MSFWSCLKWHTSNPWITRENQQTISEYGAHDCQKIEIEPYIKTFETNVQLIIELFLLCVQMIMSCRIWLICLKAHSSAM